MMLARMVVAALSLAALVGCAAAPGRIGVVSGGEPRLYFWSRLPKAPARRGRC